MMTYNELTEEFIEAISTAIEAYTDRFETVDAIPAHRKVDLQKLNGILEAPVGDFYTVRKDITRILDDLTTGWLFFRTGNSQLKSNILDVLKERQFTEIGIMDRKVTRLEQTLEYLIRNPDANPYIEQLEHTVQDKENEIAELTVKNTELSVSCQSWSDLYQQEKEENEKLRRLLARANGFDENESHEKDNVKKTKKAPTAGKSAEQDEYSYRRNSSSDEGVTNHPKTQSRPIPTKQNRKGRSADTGLFADKKKKSTQSKQNEYRSYDRLSEDSSETENDGKIRINFPKGNISTSPGIMGVSMGTQPFHY